MRYHGRRDIAEVAAIAFGRAMPDAAPECGDIDLAGVVRVWDYSLSPLEIETRDALPTEAGIFRSPRRRLEAGRVGQIRRTLIHGYIKDVLVGRQHMTP